jgi:hypothetical protein
MDQLRKWRGVAEGVIRVCGSDADAVVLSRDGWRMIVANAIDPPAGTADYAFGSIRPTSCTSPFARSGARAKLLIPVVDFVVAARTTVSDQDIVVDIANSPGRLDSAVVGKVAAVYRVEGTPKLVVGAA